MDQKLLFTFFFLYVHVCNVWVSAGNGTLEFVTLVILLIYVVFMALYVHPTVRIAPIHPFQWTPGKKKKKIKTPTSRTRISRFGCHSNLNCKTLNIWYDWVFYFIFLRGFQDENSIKKLLAKCKNYPVEWL